MILQDRPDRWSRNVGNYHSTLRNIPENRRTHFHHGGSSKSRTVRYTNIQNVSSFLSEVSLRFLKFYIQGSVHRKYIPLDIFPTRCNITQFIYFWKTALHVSGGISTHHQEHTQLYLQYLILRPAPTLQQ